MSSAKYQSFSSRFDVSVVHLMPSCGIIMIQINHQITSLWRLFLSNSLHLFQSYITAQLVLATDGDRSFGVFSYDDLDIPSCEIPVRQLSQIQRIGNHINTLSALPPLCAGNVLVTGGSPHKSQ